jgi:translation initiation factor 3 subunit I
MIRPLLLKGHEKSITQIAYNREGDLLFSASRAEFVAVWWADNGERIGSYHGHNGAVWFLDVSQDSKKLLTCSADSSAKIWNVETGKELAHFAHRYPVRSCGWGHGAKMILTATDQVMGATPVISLFKVADDPRDQNDTPIREIPGPGLHKIYHAVFRPNNETIYTCNEDGTVRVYDTETGKQINIVNVHKKAVNRMQFDKHQLTFITASRDGTARLFDTKSLQNLKTYDAGRPVNAASMSSIKDHIILGGGEAAINVTLTKLDTTQFKTRFFHKLYETELGSLMGHFGPVNALTFSPDGTGFASGGEDGYVRLHHFDQSYYEPDDDETWNPSREMNMGASNTNNKDA